jgi:hypothetical protein
MTRDPINFAASDIAALIPQDLARADHLLTEYGRWATRTGGRGKPATLDRWYRPESDGRESREAYRARCAAVPTMPLMPAPDALAVQRALTRVADRERIVLQILYVPARLPPHAQLRTLRIPPQLSRIRHLAGLRQFDNLHRLCIMRPT